MPPSLTSAAPEPWPSFGDLARYRAVGAFPSEHRGARTFARVTVNDAAAPYADGCVTLVPGAVVVSSLSDSPDGVASEHYVMERKANGWGYFVVGPEGTVRRGESERCARCHAEAPSDEVFGVPGKPRKKCIPGPQP